MERRRKVLHFVFEVCYEEREREREREREKRMMLDGK